MNLYDVYPLFDVNIVKGDGCKVWDDKGNEYLDLYGGHAVISIGHAHPHYVEAIASQVARLGFYSNSVQNPLQKELALTLGKVSGYEDYQLFLINSGAEANENAMASLRADRQACPSPNEYPLGTTVLSPITYDRKVIVASQSDYAENASFHSYYVA